MLFASSGSSGHNVALHVPLWNWGVAIGLIVGLNISKGGDGSSGYGKPKEWSMTGKEILQYGHALLGVPSACAFISWDSRPDVINRPDVSAALRDLAAAAQAHPETSCRQRAPGA